MLLFGWRNSPILQGCEAARLSKALPITDLFGSEPQDFVNQAQHDCVRDNCQKISGGCVYYTPIADKYASIPGLLTRHITTSSTSGR